MTLRLRCICMRTNLGVGVGAGTILTCMHATCGRAGPPRAALGQLQWKLVTWDRVRRVRKLAAPGRQRSGRLASDSTPGLQAAQSASVGAALSVHPVLAPRAFRIGHGGPRSCLMSSDGGVPAGSGETLPGPPSTPPSALLRLIQLLSGQQLDAAATRDDRAIARAAAAALQEAGAHGGSGVPTAGARPAQAAALVATLHCFGYKPSAGFTLPLDARRLATCLRGLLYSGQQHCGGGTYALCFRATFLPTGRPVVLKRLRIEQSEEGVPSLALRELSLMRALEGSGHIVQ